MTVRRRQWLDSPLRHMSHWPQTQLISATTRLPRRFLGTVDDHADELVADDAA